MTLSDNASDETDWNVKRATEEPNTFVLPCCYEPEDKLHDEDKKNNFQLPHVVFLLTIQGLISNYF